MKPGNIRSGRVTSVLTLAAISVSIGIILASSALMYTAGGAYHTVYEDPDLKVELRINRFNTNPPKFVMAQTNVRITNNYDDDIYIVEFKVEAYSTDDPEADETKKYGEQSISGLSIPAHTTTVVKVNVKIYNYTDFKNDDTVYGFYFLKWQHFGDEYAKLGMHEVDMVYWKTLFPLP